MLLRQPYTANQVCVPGIRAERFIHRIAFQPYQRTASSSAVFVPVGVLKPVEGTVFVSDDAVELCQNVGHVDLSFPLKLLEISGQHSNRCVKPCSLKDMVQGRCKLSEAQEPSCLLQLFDRLRISADYRISLK